jgi:DNA polymerase I-like protein with 3'-5' exonuclease and polymerase domains
MEWNGLHIDIITARQRAEELQTEIKAIEEQLNQHCGGITLNWDSPDNLSLFLYGGMLKVDGREVIGVYKSGAKVGEPRYKKTIDEIPLPRRFEPIPRSELKKEGFYSTDESILRQLGKSPIIDLLLERSLLKKLQESLIGLDNIIAKKDWPDGELHGQLNQCVAQTGRLSSSQPNQQNFADEVKELIQSRYV